MPDLLEVPKTIRHLAYGLAEAARTTGATTLPELGAELARARAQWCREHGACWMYQPRSCLELRGVWCHDGVRDATTA
jgi:hypothetical protein